MAGGSGLIGVVPSLSWAGFGMLVIGWLMSSALAPRSEGGPTPVALAAIPEADLNAILADQELLTSILTYRVVGGESLDMPSLAEAGSITTVNGADLSIAAVGDVIEVNGVAATLCGKVQTANATVHVIDTVLVPAA
jgi:uncharacterized surface protein with fasciclin (FAS1) repeats